MQSCTTSVIEDMYAFSLRVPLMKTVRVPLCLTICTDKKVKMFILSRTQYYGVSWKGDIFK